MLGSMSRKSVSLPTLLLWVLMALLPLRSVASAWMVAAPVPGAEVTAVEWPCHEPADAAAADQTDPDSARHEAHNGDTGPGVCQHCDLCHSPSLIASLPIVETADSARDVWLTADARVPATGQQPQRRPPRV